MSFYPYRPEFLDQLNRILKSDLDHWVWASMTDMNGFDWPGSLQLAQIIHDYVFTGDLSGYHGNKPHKFEADLKASIENFIRKEGRWCPLTEWY